MGSDNFEITMGFIAICAVTPFAVLAYFVWRG